MISTSGFQASSSGQLGAGVYLAQEPKAVNFATSAISRGKGDGSVVIKCAVFGVIKVKKVQAAIEAGTWYPEFDACECEHTALSRSPEWCIGDPTKVVAVAWRYPHETEWKSMSVV